MSLLFASLLLCQSCMVSRIVHEDDCDSAFMKKKTTWSLVWGLVQPKDINPQCRNGGMNKVAVKTNLGFILISAVTVGLVVPQRLEWCCTPPDDATEPVRSAANRK